MIAAVAFAALLNETIVVEMRVDRGGRSAGEATFTRALQDDGRIVADLSLELDSDGTTVYIDERRVHELDGGISLQERRYRFDTIDILLRLEKLESGGYELFSESGYGELRDDVDAPDGPTADASVRWFVDATPAPGDRVETVEFDLDLERWEPRWTRYEGRVDHPWGGETLRLHRVVDSSGQIALLDDVGMPVHVQLPGPEGQPATTLVRVGAPTTSPAS